MQVLLINQSDISGGAGISCYRLHQELSRQSADSRLLVDNAKLDQTGVYLIERHRLGENLFERLSYKLGLKYLSISNSFWIDRSVLYEFADILNFHNLHGGYFNYLAIPKLTKNKPAIFTLHDMWSFTGHCAYSFECDRWQAGCGKCPHLDTYPAVSRDNTAIEWKLKRWVYSRSNLTIVTPSKWLARLAKKSILNRFPIHHIPNGLDLNAYQPLDSELCRTALGLPLNKKILLFTAQSLQDSRKGGDLLVQALQKLPASLKADLILMTMGDGGEKLVNSVDIPIISLGYIGGDRLKALVYSAADIFVFPTRADNLPLVVQESLACGTPIVSFDVGGVPDMVRPGITGYLAEPENSTDLATRIIELLEDNLTRDKMGTYCREIAVDEYSIELQAKLYMHLYRQAIDGFKKR